MEESKMVLNTTPIKNTSTITALNISTPDQFNPNLTTRIRNQNNVGSDPLNLVPKKKKQGSRSHKPTSILPQKYVMLCDFFVAMVNSLRLLRLKGVPSTFTKLAFHIESLTNRRFTLHHLAQMKYILQEMIVVKKIRVLNEKTNCMQEDYLLSIDMDAMEIDKHTNGGNGNGYSQVKEIFRSRVIDFSKTHLEDEDIPKGELPHLSHQPNHQTKSNSNTSSMPLLSSLVAPSFKRQFSSKTLRTQNFESSQTPIKEASSSKVTFGFSGLTNEALMGPVLTPVKLASTPLKCTSTPSQLASTPIRLMAATPAIRTPKRTLMTRDDDDDDCEHTANKSTKRRSLKFDERTVDIKDELGQVDEKEDIFSSQSSMIAKVDVLAVLPENVLQSLIDKEKKLIEEKDPIISQARRRQQIITRLGLRNNLSCYKNLHLSTCPSGFLSVVILS